MNASVRRREIPGTKLFDGEQDSKGHALNKMSFSFNDAANREALQADEAGYCAKYGLTAPQRAAIEAATCCNSSPPAATCTTWPSLPASLAWTCRTWAPSRPA